MENIVNGNLPNDLLLEILWKLPVKHLLRCKSVCKDWCTIIESPSFADHHFGLESNQESLLFQIENINDEPCAFSLYQDDERPSRVEESEFLAQMPNGDRLLVLLGPLKGIFCAVSDYGPLVVLLNPATRELKELPPILFGDDPSMLVFGFGFDQSTRDFKVVAFQVCKSPSYSICAYSVSSNSWKIIEGVHSLRQINSLRDSGNYPFLNGVYHWLMEMVDDQGFGILAFDMRSESSHVKQVPESLRYSNGCLHIATYGDSLAMLSYTIGDTIDLWAMGSDGIWNKSVTVGPVEHPLWPLCVWKKNAMLFQVETIGVIRFDVSTERDRVIVPIVEPSFVCGVFSYKESIFSVKGVGDRAVCVQDLFDRLPEGEDE